MGDGYGGSSGGSAVQNQNTQAIPSFGPQSIQSLKGAAQGGGFQEGPALLAQALGPGQSPMNPALGSGGIAAGGSAALLQSKLRSLSGGSIGGSGGQISGGAATMPGGIGGALL